MNIHDLPHYRAFWQMRLEVNHNIYNIGAPAFSINSQNTGFSAVGSCAKKCDYTVPLDSIQQMSIEAG